MVSYSSLSLSRSGGNIPTRKYEQQTQNPRADLNAAFGSRWRTVLAEGIRVVLGFKRFLNAEHRHSGPHYVCACLALADARKLGSDGKISLMNAMMHEKRGELLGRLCDGFTWPDSGLKALAKLNTTECRRADYVRLGGYLRQPKTAKVLAHAHHLSPAILRAIGELQTGSVCLTCWKFSKSPRLSRPSRLRLQRISGICHVSFNAV